MKLRNMPKSEKPNDRARLAEAAFLYRKYRLENKNALCYTEMDKIWSIKRGFQRFVSNMIRWRMT